ncbi:MAG TPA: multidrug ABC transporter ATP-binding protein [Cupriavidus sp.]|nr:multidrug ABC transporter ATP-binding protein [Cupriavidus sp.]
MSNSDFLLSVQGVNKRFGGLQALSDVGLQINPGEIYGLIGPNGAGKSTLINILAGLTIRTGGTALVWGHDIDTEMRRARTAIGVVPQELNLDPFFSPREVLEVQAGYYAVPPAERRTMEILEAVGLADKADAYARSLSGGMRRRLLVAKALVHSPPVVVLDEPTAGLDPNQIKQFRDNIQRLGRTKTLLISTHILQEVEAVADRVLLIHDGRLLYDGPRVDLEQNGSLEEPFYRLTREPAADAAPDAEARTPPVASGDATPPGGPDQ